jgi:ribosomal protein S18 acetylase RimI-like enzyme
MIIRDARTGDIAAVWHLIGQLAEAPDEAEFRHRFERVLASEGHRVIVAEAGGDVVGVLHVFERPALEKPCEAVVQALVVDSERRRAGVGETLMREAEAWAASRKLGSTALYTRIDRDRARRFYERLGYRHKGTSHLMGRADASALSLTKPRDASRDR